MLVAFAFPLSLTLLHPGEVVTQTAEDLAKIWLGLPVLITVISAIPVLIVTAVLFVVFGGLRKTW